MRIIVVGSRTMDDWKFFKRKMNHITKKLNRKKLVVISGGQKTWSRSRLEFYGADWYAEKWAAEEARCPAEIYHAKWKVKGRLDLSAGFKRNIEMLDKSEPDCVIAFWDGESKGTQHTIREARKRKIKVIVVRF